jgi:7-cyano-7-deazaguanine synthase
MRAVVLLSGGLDSATVLAIARHQGFEITALSIDYGQRHKDELAAAARVAKSMAIADHRLLQLDLRTIGGSALTSDDFTVPKDSTPGSGPIPITYVPARNTIFLSIALGLAEVVGAFDLFFGANALDYSGYPDCRPAFVEAFENLANVATKAAAESQGRFRVRAPLMNMNKAEIIRRGVELGVDYALTHSCYDPIAGKACGRCDSCILRRRGFEEAGVVDPTIYAGVC